VLETFQTEVMVPMLAVEIESDSGSETGIENHCGRFALLEEALEPIDGGLATSLQTDGTAREGVGQEVGTVAVYSLHNGREVCWVSCVTEKNERAVQEVAGLGERCDVMKIPLVCLPMAYLAHIEDRLMLATLLGEAASTACLHPLEFASSKGVMVVAVAASHLDGTMTLETRMDFVQRLLNELATFLRSRRYSFSYAVWPVTWWFEPKPVQSWVIESKAPSLEDSMGVQRQAADRSTDLQLLAMAMVQMPGMVRLLLLEMYNLSHQAQVSFPLTIRLAVVVHMRVVASHQESTGLALEHSRLGRPTCARVIWLASPWLVVFPLLASLCELPTIPSCSETASET
jgi:hypothetical protein